MEYMNQIKIMEYNDSRIDIYARLNEAQLFHYYEPDAGIFIAESPKVIIRALKAGYKPVSMLVEKKKEHHDISELFDGLTDDEKEVPGLRNDTISRSDHTVKIPMSHGVDSLNVAAASAVAFWELGR